GGRAVKARHTRRKRDSYVEDVVPMLIFQRDGYRCHICRRKTLPNKKVPHPRAPTIDHMIPLSLGGPHSRANVSTACFRCNTLKSASGAGDQLAIIG
ncbi:MAG TPA: HNH endonuclease, partial [Galbitalea sp.]|nr:HNH endonuclease [Galbitalea sp.]